MRNKFQSYFMLYHNSLTLNLCASLSGFAFFHCSEHYRIYNDTFWMLYEREFSVEHTQCKKQTNKQTEK